VNFRILTRSQNYKTAPNITKTATQKPNSIFRRTHQRKVHLPEKIGAADRRHQFA